MYTVRLRIKELFEKNNPGKKLDFKYLARKIHVTGIKDNDIYFLRVSERTVYKGLLAFNKGNHKRPDVLSYLPYLLKELDCKVCELIEIK